RFRVGVEARIKKALGKETQKGLDIVQHRFGLIAYVIEKKDTEVLPPRIKAYRIKIPNGSQYTLNAIKRDCEAFIRER
ncbi:ATP-dependent helicase, partial [Pseudomonas aeruginosa]